MLRPTFGRSLTMPKTLLLTVLATLLAACQPTSDVAPPAALPKTTPAPAPAANAYFDDTGRDDILGGGARRIEIDTPKGKFHVWTKRVGNNPRIKVLLLHGGPAATHEYFEAMD